MRHLCPAGRRQSHRNPFDVRCSVDTRHLRADHLPECDGTFLEHVVARNPIPDAIRSTAVIALVVKQNSRLAHGTATNLLPWTERGNTARHAQPIEHVPIRVHRTAVVEVHLGADFPRFARKWSIKA